MRLRQADQGLQGLRHAEVAEELTEYVKDLDASPAPAQKATKPEARLPPEVAKPKSQCVSTEEVARRLDASKKLEAICRTVECKHVELTQRHEALCELRQQLTEDERRIKGCVNFSDREFSNLEHRHDLCKEELQLRKEQAEAQTALKEVNSELSASKQQATYLWNKHNGSRKEVEEFSSDFLGHEASELHSSVSTDEYSQMRQKQLAEWLAADIDIKHVDIVKSRLGSLASDATSGAQALEQTAAELHADLDRRAAVILELRNRRDMHIQSGIPVLEDKILGKGCDFSVRDGSPVKRFHEIESPCKKNLADVYDLELIAVEEELADQQDLFTRSREQLQSLEERLAVLLANEAPRVHALRSWISEREPIAEARQTAYTMAGVLQESTLATADALPGGSSELLAQAVAECCSQKYTCLEQASCSKVAAERASERSAQLNRRRNGLVQRLRWAFSAEQKLSSHIVAARAAVERDQCPLVDNIARQLRTSALESLAAPHQSRRSGAKTERTKRVGVARQELREVYTKVDAKKSEQFKELTEAECRSARVKDEIAQVSEELQREAAEEKQAQLNLSEAQSEVQTEASLLPNHNIARSPRFAAQQFSTCTLNIGSPAKPKAFKGSSSSSPAAKRTQLMEDINSVTAYMNQHATKFKEEESVRQNEFEEMEVYLEHMQRSLENQRQKFQSLSGRTQKNYHEAQQRCLKAEKSHEYALVAKQYLEEEVLRARIAFERVQADYFHGGHQEAGSILQTVAEDERDCRSISGSSPGTHEPIPAPVAQCIPSILHLREQIDDKEYPGVHSFLMQVAPLFKGVQLEILRRAKQCFETREFSLSRDLQRLEVRRPSAPSHETCTADARARFVESFIRVSCIERIYINTSTMAEVRRFMEARGSTHQGTWNSSCDSSPRDRSKDAAKSNSPPGRMPSPRSDAINLQHGLLFDIVLKGVESWRIRASDVQTFQAATAAISSILSSRALLPDYASALSHAMVRMPALPSAT